MSTGASFVTALPVCVKASAEMRAESAYNLALPTCVKPFALILISGDTTVPLFCTLPLLSTVILFCAESIPLLFTPKPSLVPTKYILFAYIPPI